MKLRALRTAVAAALARDLDAVRAAHVDAWASTRHPRIAELVDLVEPRASRLEPPGITGRSGTAAWRTAVTALPYEIVIDAGPRFAVTAGNRGRFAPRSPDDQLRARLAEICGRMPLILDRTVDMRDLIWQLD